MADADADAVAAASSPSSSPYLPPPFNRSPPDSLTLITQGAEALVYRTAFGDAGQLCALKVRPPKPWRHAQLDRRLTRQRILAEARVLVRCRRDGVPVPAVFAVDWEAGWSAVEWIAGATVKDVLRRRSSSSSSSSAGGSGGGGGGGGGQSLAEGDAERLRELLRRVGAAVGKLHATGVVHGDLTTSNMILRPPRPPPPTAEGGSAADAGLDGEIVLIDFGLAVQAVQEEDRAVDLYVLERAFGSTHPKEEQEFGEVLKAYEGSYKGAKATLRRLEDVRMRGRKKSMIG